MATNIQVLPPLVVNRIAAGEVLERPASAIKELVENSIDAGATQIDIEVRQGGKNLISISDNGKGMSKDELPLAVERHATSKLPEHDLLDINFLGFRGEALPSIGSVSRMTIISKAANSNEAWQLDIESGNKSQPQPANRQKGTKITVSDLFYATPARLKFLKSDKAELIAINDIVKRLAMANPEISFTLTNDGKTTLNYDARQVEANFEEAQKKRLNDILGNSFIDNAIHIDITTEQGYRMYGYASLPTYNRGTADNLYFFINGRAIKDKLMLGSIKAAYQDFLARGRYPSCALFFTMPNTHVDVNVHPAKAEVRFRYAQEVRNLLVSGVKNAIAKAGHRASTTVADFTLKAMQPNIAPNMPQQTSFVMPKIGGNRSSLNTYASVNAPKTQLAEEFTPIASQSPQSVEPQPINNNYPLGNAKTQLFETYIIAQNTKGIVIVDQHAVHERLVYERLKKQWAENGIATQSVIIPHIIEFEDKALHKLMSIQNEIKKFGFDFEKFGNNEIAVTQIPALLADEDITKLFKNIADDLLEHGEALSLNNIFEDILGTIACHNSIRAGRKLSIEEMNEMLRQMEATPHSGQCNHGRPTYVEFELKDVEKLFGRR